MSRAVLTLLAAGLAAGLPALAHDGEDHATATEAAADAADAAPAGLPLPFALGGPFALTDQDGAIRTQADPDGRMQLLFFGYANCPSICAVALPLMAEVTDSLAARGLPVTPVMITVDPARDTTRTIGPPLEAIHPAFVGLTGSEADLRTAYDAFRIEKEVVFEDPEHGPIFAHGSHIYLLSADGAFLTLLPPILSADRITEIAMGY